MKEFKFTLLCLVTSIDKVFECLLTSCLLLAAYNLATLVYDQIGLFKTASRVLCSAV